MNYPVWNLPSTGGSTLIAIIAIAHVVIAHLAVGGGLFLVLTERKARKTNDAGMLAYVRSHTWFFLLLTMVFGGVTGVGIWFIIALVSPGATSALIHSFVFGWAIEWVFFIGEIVALLIYHYRWDKMSARNHMIMGWLYFVFAWLSLFIINGILSFMLTPGQWIETGDFWQGFLNPGFLPSLLFRTFIAVMIAGVFGLITASFNKDKALRNRIFRYCAKWMYFPLVFLFLTGLYYYKVVGPDGFESIFHFNPDSSLFADIMLVSSFVLFGLGLFTLVKLPSFLQKVVAFLLVIIVWVWMGGFEYLREIARKPYVIYAYMYSNGITKQDATKIQEKGFLATAKWTDIKEVTPDNQLQAGGELFKMQCLSCHTIDGRNAIIPLTEKLTERGLEAQLTGMGRVNAYMPPFFGNEAEKKALAAYLFYEVLEKEPIEVDPFIAEEYDFDIPEFDQRNDEYVLLVWNDLGMHCISDNEKYFSFLPPANTFMAQLFKRGEKPEIITEGVEIQYNVEPGFENLADNSMFWEYSEPIFGVQVPEGKGLKGKGVNDIMDTHGNHFAAELFPIIPYRDDGKYNPYPLFNIKAVDKNSGEVLIETMAVAPTSTEMGCRNCHGGGWAWNGMSGVADETAENILAAHDRYNGTKLLEDALNGQPRLCQSCHADPAVGSPGLPGVLNFSTAIHGFHANYLTDMDAQACNMCHPARVDGNTTCFRGRHAKNDLTCINCHGTMEDHALGLLAHEKGKPSQQRLARGLEPRQIDDIEAIHPRMPWLNEPDCRSCHYGYDIRKEGFSGTAFNKWAAGFTDLYRNRTDGQGVMCISCHGSPHAVYGAENKFGLQRDNIQPLQYQKLAGTIGTYDNCQLCHTRKMIVNGHHRNQVMRKMPVALVE